MCLYIFFLLQYLLISTDKSGSGRLFLELSTGAYRNLLAAVRHQKESGTMPPDFVVEGLPQLPRSARVVVQETPNFGPVITAFDPTSCVLEIYGAELGKFPLFSYQLPAGAVGFHFTRHVTFVFVDPASAVAPANDAGQRTQHLQLPPPQRPSIYVVSNRIASRLTTVRSSTRRELCSVMQRFCLESDERFGGTFYIPTAGGVSSSSSSISSVDGGEDESSGAQGGGSSAGGLHGCFMWTTRSLLDCEPATRPEDLFRQLVAQGLERTDAEDFGKTLGLDLYTLYEQSADACFERGEYERALDLYALSNVRSSKLVLRYLGIDRLDVVIAHLGARLRRAETLPAGDRAALANLLFQASLLRLLPSNTGNNNNNSGNSKDTADFEEFLVTNMDYDAEAAMRHLLAQGPGFLKLLLLAAHSRRRVPEALMLLCKRGRIHLPREHVEFLLENGYGAELSKCHSLLEVLPPDAQVHCILDSPQTLPYNFRSLWGLLPRASGDTLFRVVALLSPRSPILPVLLDPEPLPRNAFLGQLPAQPPSPIKPEEICELRLAALMVLAAHHYKPSPAALTAAAAAATTTTTTPATTGLPTDSETKDTNAQQQQQQVIPSSLQPQPQRMFNQICCGYNHVLAVTESGELYSWGSNTYGQLGHGTTFGVCYPKRVERLAGDPVLRIAAGGAHSFAVMYNAAVWAWGLNASGQLGIGVDYDPDKYKTAPVPVDAFRGLLLKQIACGHAHTLFVADDGRIFACGDNTHGQLGIGAAAAAASTYSSSPVLLSSSSSSSSLTTTTPTLSTSPSMFGGGSGISSTSGTGYCCCQTPTYVRIQSTHRIHSVACGYDHSCACTEAGKVYTWGYGDQGQLGHGVFEDESTPRAVATLSSKYITAIYCGHYCTAALTDLSDVYTWGRNTNGELGHGEGPNTAEPRPVQSIAHEQVAALACGSTHTLAVCDSGKLYAWGYSKAGALGLGSGEEEISTTPKRVQAPPLQRPVACDCGDNFNVLLAVPEEPQKKEGSAASAGIATYTWGNNAEGQLGTGKSVNLLVPTFIEIPVLPESTATFQPRKIHTAITISVFIHTFILFTLFFVYII